MKYLGFEVDDNKIDEYIDKLGVSIAEACELILEEAGKLDEPEEVTEAIKDAEKNVKRRYERGEKKRKQTSKERKVDEVKGYLIGCTKTLLEGLGATETAVKTETEISFQYQGANYTFKLTKHRPPKNTNHKPLGPTEAEIIHSNYLDLQGELERANERKGW